jgi:NAD(P)-dependent dehydrogenase (short-subunit alcohol dehydrogenase family)
MSDSVAVVVGVGPGLGQAAARRFAAGGLRVAMIARTAEKLEALRDAIAKEGGSALPVAADATDAGSLKAAFERVERELGAPSVLVYNAGAFQMGGVLEVSADDFERCWRANCFGGFVAAQTVAPAMLERGKGSLLFTGATAALRGSARFSCLAVGKFGLRALTQSLARELGPRGIHVAHVVVDGQIDTPRLREMMPGRDPATMLAPDAIAETFYQLHAQHPSAWTLELDVRPHVEKF